MQSHPMWVRGLKHISVELVVVDSRMSHPMWVRGLKLSYKLMIVSQLLVAPHVGAWIETLSIKQVEESEAVAPHVGAWIETSCTMRVRAFLQVAPHVGAWIETSPRRKMVLAGLSHPMWVRGLKPVSVIISR